MDLTSSRRRVRSFALGLTLAACSVVMIASGGCQAVVTGTLPAYSCAGLDPSVACPSGKVCFQTLGECVDPSAVCALLNCPSGSNCDTSTATCVGSGIVPLDGSVGPAQGDSSVPVIVPEAGDVTDTYVPPPADVQSACRGLGCRCAGMDDCDSLICGDTLTLTADVLAVTKSNVCTKPCCSSLDCDANTVCFAAGNGGNYCVKPSIVGRDMPITRAAAGASCNVDADCASARCVTGKCVDTCCSASAAACGGGLSCALGKFPGKGTFDTHTTFACIPSSASGNNGDTCQRNSDCKSALCEPTCSFCSSKCQTACRNTGECPATEACADVSLSQTTGTNDVGVFCFAGPGPLGTKAVGAACTGDQECRSGTCDTRLKACVDVCFADSDCAGAPAGWHCRPTTITVNGGGSYSVLACGT